MPKPNSPAPIEPMEQPSRNLGRTAVGGSALAVVVASMLAATFANEGGYVNHPNDPGGATNHGITEVVARKHGYKGDMRHLERWCELPLSPAVDENGKATKPKSVCAASILFKDYIVKPGILPLVQIDPPVAEEVFDSATNFGPGRPSRFFQNAVNEVCKTNLKVDGQLGPQTWAAWHECRFNVGKSACVAVLNSLDAQQQAEYDRLVRINPRLKVFYRGWINLRIGNVKRSRCGELLPFEPVKVA